MLVLYYLIILEAIEFQCYVLITSNYLHHIPFLFLLSMLLMNSHFLAHSHYCFEEENKGFDHMEPLENKVKITV
jgi:hypothetical protein